MQNWKECIIRMCVLQWGTPLHSSLFMHMWLIAYKWGFSNENKHGAFKNLHICVI
jgi:hypothetical protein